MKWALLWLLQAAVAMAQSPGTPRFEVASVKATGPAHGPGSTHGGPGTNAPGQITWTKMSMRYLLQHIYGLKDYQIIGPEWFDTDGFDIVAKVPAETTKEQLNIMVRNLLADRFKMTVHPDSKPMRAYVLTVGPGGKKFTETKTPLRQPPSADGPLPPPKLQMAPDGYPDLSPAGGRKIGILIMNGRGRLRYTRVAMSSLSDLLTIETGKPIVDQTGLTALYDFDLYWVSQKPGMAAPIAPPDAALPAAQDPGPNIIEAVQKQLGLKLELRTAPIPVLVVDHVEREPIGN